MNKFKSYVACRHKHISSSFSSENFVYRATQVQQHIRVSNFMLVGKAAQRKDETETNVKHRKERVCMYTDRDNKILA